MLSSKLARQCSSSQAVQHMRAVPSLVPVQQQQQQQRFRPSPAAAHPLCHQQQLLCALPATQPSLQHHAFSSSSSSSMQQQQRRRRGVLCCAAGGGSSKSKQPKGPLDVTNNMDDMEDVILVDDSDDEGEGEDEFEFEDDGFVDFDEDDDVITDEDADFEGEEGDGLLGIGSEEDPGPEVLTGNVDWGDKALQVAEAVLGRPENSNLSLYLFRVMVPSKTIEIRLDKLDDAYGSPGLEDIERFSRALAQGIEAELGPEAAGEVSFEVSSPGAERTLILPQDLLRFKELPMRVEYMSEVGVMQNVVMRFLELDEFNSSTLWELADVKANQAVKGRGLSKKQRMQRFDIPLESLERVRIYVDF